MWLNEPPVQKHCLPPWVDRATVATQVSSSHRCGVVSCCWLATATPSTATFWRSSVITSRMLLHPCLRMLDCYMCSIIPMCHSTETAHNKDTPCLAVTLHIHSTHCSSSYHWQLWVDDILHPHKLSQNEFWCYQEFVGVRIPEYIKITDTHNKLDDACFAGNIQYNICPLMKNERNNSQ